MEFPKFEASPASFPLDLESLISYMIFREHWELIDKVFQIETPGEPTRNDMIRLAQILFAANEKHECSSVRQMLVLVDDLILDTMSEQELTKENAIREIIYDSFAESGDLPPNARLEMIKGIRLAWENNIATA